MKRVWAFSILSFIAAAVLSVATLLDKQNAALPAHEAVFSIATTTKVKHVIPEKKVLPPARAQYIEVSTSCGPYYGGTCLRARSGPGTEYPVVAKLREGMVLKTSGLVVTENQQWYQIAFDEWLRYPDRMQGEMYVAADYVDPFSNTGPQELLAGAAAAVSDKYIIVDRSEQMLYAYQGKELFMKLSISTGLELTPTPRGSFTVYRKTPTRYMQGPIPGISDQEYDLPGVPWNLFFTQEGGAIHGAYWHDHFGTPWSHGCVNLPPEKAKELYEWAPIGTKVLVRD